MASLLTICSPSHSERRALPIKIYDGRARSPTPLRANMYPQRPFPRRPTPQSRSPTPHLYRYCCSSVDPCVRLCLRAYFASGGTPRWFEYTSPVCNGGSRRHPQHKMRISKGCTPPLLASFLDAPLYRSFLLKPIVFQETKVNTPSSLEPVQYPIDFPHSRGRIYHDLSDSEVGFVAPLLISYLQSTIPQVACPTPIEKGPRR